MTAPPVLTAERIDAMLSIMAEVCLESVVDAGARQKAAEDAEAFERSGRALQAACRNLRQTIALKQRFDREEAGKADDARRAAEATRIEAAREHRDAVARHHARIRRHFERVLWNEYEEDDAQERFEDLDDRLSDLAEYPDFLATPAETLIRRLAQEIDRRKAPPAKPAALAKARAEPTRPEPPPSPPAARPRPAERPAPPEAREPPAPPAEAVRPHPPPEPPPEPYIPPWERLRPGQRAPGGTGW